MLTVVIPVFNEEGRLPAPVRRSKIQIRVEGKTVIDWPVDPSQCRAVPYLTGMVDPKAITPAASSSDTFSRAHLTPASGAGKKLR